MLPPSLPHLEAEINDDVEAAGGDEGDGEDPLVAPPDRVLHQRRDARHRRRRLHLLRHHGLQHLGRFRVAQNIWP